ncbi:hypothetical protein BZG36_03072 [Bifiguratus adelaidae]|uniref:FHA domain-containing protein n=1 Tax=Bifiguratus adelaidae TaxID=1938954 RepID=A0A261XZK0_9FUNG|nr:hypothetical protein BZG36_03072 [Bifiguratus adelaidae]
MSSKGSMANLTPEDNEYQETDHPTLILTPVDENFIPKTLDLPAGAKVKIGRQTSTKTLPSSVNGYFDSKVLSRTHAEIWQDKGRVLIKDVKSSNGTFLNGNRLSNEGEESGPVELNTDDILEFGIDIMNEDGSILYHKIATRVHIHPKPFATMDNSTLQSLGVDTSALSTPLLTPSSSIESTKHSKSSSGHSKGISLETLESLVSTLQAEVQKTLLSNAELITIKSVMEEVNESFLQNPPNTEMSPPKDSVEELQNSLHATKDLLASTQSALSSAQTELDVAKSQLSHLVNANESLNLHLMEVQKVNLQLEDEVDRLKERQNDSESHLVSRSKERNVDDWVEEDWEQALEESIQGPGITLNIHGCKRLFQVAPGHYVLSEDVDKLPKQKQRPESSDDQMTKHDTDIANTRRIQVMFAGKVLRFTV